MPRKKKRFNTSSEVAVMFRIPPALIRQLDLLANKEQRSRSGMVKWILETHLKELVEKGHLKGSFVREIEQRAVRGDFD